MYRVILITVYLVYVHKVILITIKLVNLQGVIFTASRIVNNKIDWLLLLNGLVLNHHQLLLMRIQYLFSAFHLY